jgi:hypothetical protein
VGPIGVADYSTSGLISTPHWLHASHGDGELIDHRTIELTGRYRHSRLPPATLPARLTLAVENFKWEMLAVDKQLVACAAGEAEAQRRVNDTYSAGVDDFRRHIERDHARKNELAIRWRIPVAERGERSAVVNNFRPSAHQSCKSSTAHENSGEVSTVRLRIDFRQFVGDVEWLACAESSSG